jgi:Carboxypeptidase regulatory-like domain
MADDGATFETTTDASGAYRLSLPDGAYVVTPVLEGAGPSTAASVAVTVSGGQMRTLDLQVDTGIR